MRLHSRRNPAHGVVRAVPLYYYLIKTHIRSQEDLEVYSQHCSLIKDREYIQSTIRWSLATGQCVSVTNSGHVLILALVYMPNSGKVGEPFSYTNQGEISIVSQSHSQRRYEEPALSSRALPFVIVMS